MLPPADGMDDLERSVRGFLPRYLRPAGGEWTEGDVHDLVRRTRAAMRAQREGSR